MVLIGGVPVTISGKFWLDAEIDGEVTGAMTASQKLDMGFDELSYGIHYSDAEGWKTVSKQKPRFTVEVQGEANAKAIVNVALVPQLTVKVLQYPTARMAVRPFLTATAGVEGKVYYKADLVNAEQTQDADYWLTEMSLKGQMDAYFYGAIEGLDNRPIKVFKWTLVYPNKEAKFDDYTTFQKVTMINSTTFMDIPKLEASLDTTKTLNKNTRTVLVAAKSTDVQSPFRRFIVPFGPEAF